MCLRKVFYVFCLSFFVWIVSGATAEFRSGTVLAADFTTSCPDAKLAKSNVPNRIFARMVVNLPADRKLSIYDYSLRAFGRDFKAVAVSVNNGNWLMEGESVENIDGKTRVSILFEVDGSVIGKRNVEEFEIVATAHPGFGVSRIKFKNLGNGKFSNVSGISNSGVVVK